MRGTTTPTDPRTRLTPPLATRARATGRLAAGRLLLIFLLPLLLTDCVGRKNINYLHDRALSNTAKLFENQKFEYRLQVNDVLSIRVLGLDDKTTQFFNIERTEGAIGMSEAAMYVNGFSVDKNGQVTLPTVGKVKVQGLTIGEAQDLVQRKINEYFTTATVILKMVSFRVSVLGDVARPGSYTVFNNQITLLEALSMSGGPTELADKRHVTLLRQSDKGTQAVYVDLGDMDVLSSQYYYLLPNDVVYVPTLKARPGRLNLELLGILLTAVTTTVLVLTYVKQTNP